MNIRNTKLVKKQIEGYLYKVHSQRTHLKMKKISILALAVGCAYGASAQYVTSIWSDYDGFWTSSNASVSPIEPDSSHHLLAFEWGGTIFSTGVNDGILPTQWPIPRVDSVE